jgi:serine/threonine protein kinase
MKVCPVCKKEYPNTMTLCSADAAPLKSVSDPLLGQTLAGKYLIEELIKRGGMGAVYRGKHVLMDKTVAIKVLRPSLAVDDAVVARFSREAKAASRISHPHAVSVTDFGEAETGVVFLVMEYLDGRTLKEIIRGEGPMPLNRVVEIVRQVTGALDAAHAQGVVHRDLKSDNIMLSQTNGGDWAKVLDFGIAKIQQPANVKDADFTAPNVVVGTPQYMSPEQCSQTQPLDARSDVYSLGVIVYEMLAGRVPFTGESATMIMMQHVQDAPPSILATRPDLPAAVDQVVVRALAKHPADRFQTAGELSAALSAAAAGPGAGAAPRAVETVSSAPVSPAADDLDEETVVHPRAPLHTPAAASDAPTNFSPWRIIVPSAIVLVVVFGIVFLLTRTAGQPQPKPTPGQAELAADPNSEPVQQGSPPTGASERDIQSLPGASPAGSVNTNANVNQGSRLPPDVLGNYAANANGNDNANTNVSGRGNKNANQPSESPRPSPSVSIKTETTPPPKPSPSVQTIPKPTATPPAKLR